MKLFAAIGPGDIVAAHRALQKGERFISETSIIFSGQLLEYCRLRDIETLALSHHRRLDCVNDGHLTLENRPRKFEWGEGWRYHFGSILYAVYLAWRARRFGADLAIIDSGSAHYFALALFWLAGVPVAINFHNSLWPNGFRPYQGGARQILALNSWFFRHVAAGGIGCSPECRIQAQQLAGRDFPFFEYRGQFRGSDFSDRVFNDERNPFRIIFVGRAERNKGVLDIVCMAERLRGQSDAPVHFEVCGDGAALDELKRLVAEQGLGNTIHIHGRLALPDLLGVYARAHAVIVPTRSDFCEGLPLVCAEAVLSGLPIITSRLSNALPVLGPAIAVAEPENIESYVEAIKKLVEDRSAYDRLRGACPDLALQFLDRSQSYPAAVDRLIAHLRRGWIPLRDFEPLFARLA